MLGNLSENGVNALSRSLVNEAHELLSSTIAATQAADERAIGQRASWTQRHRLQVLLEAIEVFQQSSMAAGEPPWFLAELHATLAVVRKWRTRPGWEKVSDSLVDPRAFAHNIAMLHVADHLETGGQTVYIVGTGKDASPDLVIHDTQRSQELLRVECYQPTHLSGEPSALSTKTAKRILKKAMEKAKRQIGPGAPGIIAICGYNQSTRNIAMLRAASQERLSQTARANLWGVALIMLGVHLKQDGDKWQLTPMVQAEFVPSPGYFHPTSIRADVPQSQLQLIKESLTDLPMAYGTLRKSTSQQDAHTDAEVPKKGRPGPNKVTKLSVIPQANGAGRAIVHGTGTKVPPLFLGDGNLDLLCGKCQALLAQSTWHPCISNIIVDCPSCHAYNEVPVTPDGDYSRVLLSPGNYSFADVVKLRRGVRLEGM